MPKIPSELLLIFAASVALVGPISYYMPSLVSRSVLVASFVVLIASLIVLKYRGNRNMLIGILLAASLFFLLWRSSFLMPSYMETALGSRLYMFAQQYALAGHLVFGDAHSYFFGPSLNLYILLSVSGLSPEVSIYASLLVYGAFAAILGMLFLEAIARAAEGNLLTKGRASVLAAVVAFSFISYCYSERSIAASGFAQISVLIALLALFLLCMRGLKNRPHTLLMLLMIGGVTLGSTDGILLLILFFLVYSIATPVKTSLVYGLIPLTYLVYAGYTYTISLKTYGESAWENFWQFIQRAIEGEVSNRVLPWERTLSMTKEDAFVTSAAYLSFLLACLIVVIVLGICLIKQKRNDEDGSRAPYWSVLIVLFVTLAVAGLTFIGISVRSETKFSDVKTIAIVFVSRMLPLAFIWRGLIRGISARRLLLIMLVLLMVVGSLRTIYEVYPKAANDPVNVIEDVRLGDDEIRVAGRHIDRYYETGGIVGDFKFLNTIRNLILLSEDRHERRLLSDAWSYEPFHRFGGTGILVFSKGGVSYPSGRISEEAYQLANTYSLTHNRMYDNGIISMSSIELKSDA